MNKKIKDLIVHFLESCRLSPDDYMYIPMTDNDQEIHIHPLAPIADDRLDRMILAGRAIGFDHIILKEVDAARCNRKELVFQMDKEDLPRIETAIIPVNLEEYEFVFLAAGQ